MDDKTEQLRELFLETTEETTVTEQQTDTRGSLADQPDVERRLSELLTAMRDRYAFQTELSDEQLHTVIEGYYDEVSDKTLANRLSVSAGTVRRARFDLHLVREADFATTVDRDRLRELHANDAACETIADVFDIDTETASRQIEAVEVELESRRANHRYRDAFASLFADADLAATHTDGALEDGLEDATEGIETNVSF